MKTYKDIVKDILDSVNYNANEQEISKAKNVLIKDLKDVPVGQFLFIEDGSIDLTELKDLKREIAEIYILQSEIKYLKGYQDASNRHR